MAKIAVVTGGGSGIGRRTIERLLAEGWSVWSFDLSEKALDQQRHELGTVKGYHSITCDVSSPESVATAFAAVKKATDRIDALICSAGVTITGSLEEMTPQQADIMIGANLKGPWLTIIGALPLLRQDATVDNPSRVVIVGSIGGIRPKVGNGMYSATKAAVHVLAGIFGFELAPSGVIVNAVAPGTVNTPMHHAVLKQASKASGFNPSGVSPLGRIAEAEDVANVIMFFLSDAAKFVNGTVLPVDGGTRAAFLKT